MDALRDNGLAEGQIFRQVILEGMVQELQRQYVSQGRYGALVKTEVKQLPRNRVAINIDIDEAMMPGILERISFGSMKKNFMKIMPESSELWKGGTDRFMNKGTNGRWRDVLTEEELAQYDKAVAKALTPDAAHWLEHGGKV